MEGLMDRLSQSDWEGKRFQLLLRGCDAADVVRDWDYHAVQADLRIRRAKTQGCVVVETTDVMFARRIFVDHPGAKVNIVI